MAGQAPSILSSLFWGTSYEPAYSRQLRFSPAHFTMCLSAASLSQLPTAALLFSTCCLSHYISGKRTSVILTGQTGLYLFIEAKNNHLDPWRLVNIFMMVNVNNLDNCIRIFQCPHHQSGKKLSLWDWMAGLNSWFDFMDILCLVLILPYN